MVYPLYNVLEQGNREQIVLTHNRGVTQMRAEDSHPWELVGNTPVI